MQHQSAKVALAHKIKQTNYHQQQNAPMRQAITKYQSTWQGITPKKQKKKQNKTKNLKPAFAVGENLCSIFCERRVTTKKH